MESLETAFARLVHAIDAGMTIVTAAGPAGPSGCLMGFHTQTSIEPPRFLACVSKANHTHGVAWDARTLIVHLVPACAGTLAELFGGETGDAVDKFAAVGWRPGPGGAPLLDELDSWFAGRVIERLDLGDHTGFLLEPVEAAAGEDASGGPFRFRAARDIPPGHPA